MGWSAIHQQSDGKLVSVGDVVADDATLTAKGLAKVALVGDPSVVPQHVRRDWNAQARRFVDTPWTQAEIDAETDRPNAGDRVRAAYVGLRALANGSGTMTTAQLTAAVRLMAGIVADLIRSNGQDV